MRIDRGWYEDEALASESWPAAGSSWPTLGWIVADWIESRLVYGPGAVTGQRIKLTLEQLVFLAWAYRIDEHTGQRAFDRVYLSRGKGWAKSEFAAWISCAEALGPVRFAGWAEDGEPVGRRVPDPWIRLLATEEGQVGNTYDCVRQALLDGPVADEFDLREGQEVQQDRVVVPGGGKLVAETASSRAKDGGRETFGVGDEIHLWILPRLIQMGDTVTRNMAKRADAQPWMLYTTTAYCPGEDSLAERVWDRMERLGGGSAPVADLKARILFDHREAGPLSEEEINGEDADVIRHLEAAYGDAEWMVTDRVVGEMREGSVADANRYFLNAVVTGEAAYMDLKAWDAAAVRGALRAGDEITLGFDGSRSDDSTALVACRVSDGLLVPVKVWNRDTSVADWRVDQDDVQATIDAARQDFRVVSFYCDPAYWWQEVAAWARDFGGNVVREFYIQGSGRRKPVHEMLEAFRQGIEEKQVRPALGAPYATDLRRHVGHAVRETHTLGYGVRKPKQELKIDACIAAGLAVEARRDHIQASETPKTYAVGSWNY